MIRIVFFTVSYNCVSFLQIWQYIVYERWETTMIYDYDISLIGMDCFLYLYLPLLIALVDPRENYHYQKCNIVEVFPREKWEGVMKYRTEGTECHLAGVSDRLHRNIKNNLTQTISQRQKIQLSILYYYITLLYITMRFNVPLRRGNKN